MTFANVINSFHKVALDSDSLIYFLEGRDPWAGLMAEVIRKAEDGKLSLVISSVGYAEILSGYYQAGNPEAAKEFNRFLFQLPKCEIVAVDASVADAGAQIRANYRLNLPDAIHLAVMKASGSDALISNDKEYRKAKDFKVLILDDYV